MVLFDETTKELVGEMNFHKTNEGYTSEMTFRFPRPTWLDILKSTVKYVSSAAATIVLINTLKNP
jgi:hypothetical protein